MVIRIVKDWNRVDHLFQQTPNNDGYWDGIRFTMDPLERCDAIVFTNRIKNEINIRCREGNRWLIQMEPPIPGNRWLRRSDKYFDYVIGPDKKVSSSKRLLTHGALPWHLQKDYNTLKSLKPGKKDKLISMITSRANLTDGHCLRTFIADLHIQKNLNFDLYGRGYNEIQDKFDALYPYKYSLVIENSFYPHYWTEKIADSLLSWTIPIYVGAPNIYNYFPRKSVIQVRPDMKEILKTVEGIESDNWDSRLQDLERARDLVLDEYQLFPFLCKNLRAISKKNGKFGEYHFKTNKSPWENGKVGAFRKIEFRIRKFLDLKPY